MKHAWDAFSRTHTWSFGDGDVSFEVPNRNLDERDDAAFVHGFKQKIGDAAAIARNTDTGASATEADKKAAMQKVIDRLNAGFWNAEKTGGKPKTINVDALVAAIAASTKRNVVGVRAWVEGKTEQQRAALVASEQFAEGYALAVAAQRKTVALDDATLAEIEAIEE